MKNLICEEFNPGEAGSYQISVEGIMFESAPYLKFNGEYWEGIPGGWVGRQIWWWPHEK